MKAFRFPLDRVLHWRTLQCELEEAAGTRLAAQRAQVAEQLSNISVLRKEAADSVTQQTMVDACDFQTLANFNVWAEQQKIKIRERAEKLRLEAEAQLVRTAEARRKRKLLEILREKRLTEWTALRDKDDEQAAADSWLSRFAAERYTTENVPPPVG